MPQPASSNSSKSGATGFFNHHVLVHKSLSKLIPIPVSGIDKEHYFNTLKDFTRSNAPNIEIYSSPKQLPLSDKTPILGKTPGGSALVSYTPFSSLKLNENDETMLVKIYIRRGDKIPRALSKLFEELGSCEKEDAQSLQVTTNSTILSDQTPRNKAKSTAAAFGGTAADEVIKLAKIHNIEISAKDIESFKFERCHKVSYKIGKNGLIAERQFDPQTKSNLAAGTRALNASMMQVENVVVKMLKEKTCKEVSYECVSQNFKDSHTLANLTLKFTITTFGDRKISFAHAFDVSDSRTLSYEIATILYFSLLAKMTQTEETLLEEKKQRVELLPSEKVVINGNAVLKENKDSFFVLSARRTENEQAKPDENPKEVLQLIDSNAKPRKLFALNTDTVPDNSEIEQKLFKSQPF